MKYFQPGSPEWKAHRAQVLTDESAQPMRLFYLSFADEKFLGAAIVEAHGVMHAIELAWSLGINPGGEVASCPVPKGLSIPDSAKNRLLSREEVEKLPGEPV